MINKAVYHILKNDTALTALVGAKVYPLVIPENVKAPCVVFYRDSLTPIYDKGSPVVDESEVAVICYTKSYPESVTIIEAVRAALEGQKGDKNGIQLILSRVRRGDEGYDVDLDIYYQALTFIFKSSKL